MSAQDAPHLSTTPAPSTPQHINVVSPLHKVYTPQGTPLYLSPGIMLKQMLPLCPTTYTMDSFSGSVPVSAVTAEEVERLVHDDATVFIDIRPYTLYLLLHLKGALNICVPTTLLKRLLFKLRNILGAMLGGQNKELERRLTQTTATPLQVVIYDENSTSGKALLHLYQTVLKFVLYAEENTMSRPLTVRYLDDGITPMLGSTLLLESGGAEDTQTLLVPGTRSTKVSPIPFTGFSLPKLMPFASSFAKSIKKNDLLFLRPAGSLRDILPELLTTQLFLAIDGASTSRRQLAATPRLPSLDLLRLPESLTEDMKKRLPLWLQPVATPEGSNILLQRFLKIEDSENARLARCVETHLPETHTYHENGLCSPLAPCPSCDKTRYTLPRGIEYGFKNRYSNIWPYEHLRVRIATLPCVRLPGTTSLSVPLVPSALDSLLVPSVPGALDDDDYFNANYVYVPHTLLNHYIATQAPLPATFEDFWRAVWSNNVQLVVCLTNLTEHGVRKSDNYWQLHTYAKLGIQVTDAEPEPVPGSTEKPVMLLRRLTVSKRGKLRVVWHVEYHDWPDFGVPPSARGILDLLGLKEKLVLQLESPEAPVLVHCSAGCGRTGTFIAVDMVLQCFQKNTRQWIHKRTRSDSLDALDTDEPARFTQFPLALPLLGTPGVLLDPWGTDDLVYKTVHLLRMQRLLMVQNALQYALCYEVVLQFLVDRRMV